MVCGILLTACFGFRLKGSSDNFTNKTFTAVTGNPQSLAIITTNYVLCYDYCSFFCFGSFSYKIYIGTDLGQFVTLILNYQYNYYRTTLLQSQNFFHKIINKMSKFKYLNL